MNERIEVTLDTCAQEPIHIPGSIQSHGVLLACRGEALVVSQVSANVVEHFGAPAESILGSQLATLLASADAQRIADAAAGDHLRESNPMRVTARNGPLFDAVLHRPPDNRELLVVELERRYTHDEGGAVFDPRLRSSVLRLQAARDVASLCNVAAEEVRAITGFDRVMVYRFDADWNGEVVAESRRDDLEPFLGLHYPASDIPAQARLLYSINWLRFIGDVGYTPSPVVPTLDPKTSAPLDMSHAVLRSVSPIHIEYLRNMGVTASMSISLLRDGKLSGLIACHHYSGPRFIPYRIRDTAEHLGQSLSWQLDVIESADRAERALRIKQIESSVVASILSSDDLLAGLRTPALTALTEAAGAVVVLEDGVHPIGSAPSRAAIDECVAWLREQAHDVFATDSLSDHVPHAAPWSDTAAGMIAVAISRDLGEYVLWFRPSHERTVDWAGDPRKGVYADGGEGKPPRLSPRGSFALWRENVKGRSVPWDALHVQAASSLRLVLLGGVRKRAVELRVLNQRLIDTDRAKDTFIATISHELRTPLNAITGWTHLLQTGALSADKWPQAFEVIARNARAQTQIVEDLLDVSRITSGKMALEIETVDLVELVQGVIEASALAVEAKGLRIKRVLDSNASPVLGDPARLRQVVSNLITNAIKFTPKGGSITVALRRQRSDVELTVSDTGQGIAPDFLPRLFEPFWQSDPGMNRRSQGLGLGLAIVRKLVELHGGRVDAASEGEGKGATFRVQLPLAPVAAPSVRETAEPAAVDCPPELDGVRVLVVEDEADARELLRVVLTQCGATVQHAADAISALALLRDETFDLVISDIGLPGTDGLQLVRMLREREAHGRRTPAVALTAYTRAIDRTRALQAGFNAHVPKPVDAHELVTVAASVIGRLPADR